jgi:hypothetical protein
MPGAKQTYQKAKTPEDDFGRGLAALGNLFFATQAYLAGMARYTTDFFIAYQVATQYFQRVEAKRLFNEAPLETFNDYAVLLQNNLELIDRSLDGTAKMMTAYAHLELDGFTEALQQSCFELKHEKLAQYIQRQAELMDMVTHGYPKAIEDIEPEYGFHFERGEHVLVDETDRFLLYRIAPSLQGLETRADAKPLLIIPPYVLGANILGFLPGEQRSYAHCFANQGYPTYIRILKQIDVTPALQVMTGEDDAKDTRRFCEVIHKTHAKPVTLNGYCQGGYNALCNLLSGQLDDLVDAFITCVSPMDGTRSRGLARFLNHLPQRFNDLAYGTKILPNGNQVADGKLMGWVYKLKSIEHEIPAAAFFRDLTMFAHQKNGAQKVSKTAAALNYWLQNERNDLPLEITRISFASYNTPITADGTLPVRLFGAKLNLNRIKEKKLPWLICYGVHDDLVEKETALAPLDHVDAEVTPFPKGHVAIATSWSFPKSACALHTRFGEGNHRGPVKFHMDLDSALDKSVRQASQASQPPAAPPTQTKKRKAKSAAGKTSPAPKKKATQKASRSRSKTTKKGPSKKPQATKKERTETASAKKAKSVQAKSASRRQTKKTSSGSSKSNPVG